MTKRAASQVSDTKLLNSQGSDLSSDGRPSGVKPNVVLVFMDDMTHWALRSKQCQTPNLDRLMARGTTLTHAFNQGSMSEAVCMPARQMLISGLTLFHAWDHYMDVPHLGETLGEDGYDTFFTGKWHNHESALTRAYDTLGPCAVGGMFDSTEVGGAAYNRPCEGNTWSPSDTSLGGHWMTLPDGTIQHSSERWTDAAVAFIHSEHAGVPFFLHLAYNAPHDPRQSPQEFLDLYPQDDVEVPPNAWPEHPFDNGELRVRDELLAPFPRTAEAVQVHRREYMAIITHMDREFGRLLDALEASGVDDSTLIVFSGDHGLALGEHGLMGKQNPYDHSIRVPLVFSGPGIPCGVEVSELVYSGSIFPTICDLVGIDIPDHVEFDSLRSVIYESGSHRREAIYGAYRDLQRLIRTERHKLIVYPPFARAQLFDIAADPWEMEDLVGTAGVSPLLASLLSQLRVLQQELGDDLQIPELHLEGSDPTLRLD